MRQIEVNALLRQRELGIRAGLPSFSCRFIQKRKAGSSAVAIQSSAIFDPLLILETSPVMTLA